MSTMERVEAAEAKMNAAEDALLSYIEAREPIDHDQHRCLLAEVRKTRAEFAKALLELGD